MNLYESVKTNLNEFNKDQYGNRTYSYDEAVATLEKLCKTLNDIFSVFEYEFDWRIEGNNLVIFDSTEAFSYDDANFDSVDKVVKSIFGNGAYLEPENSVVMIIAGAYLEEKKAPESIN